MNPRAHILLAFLLLTLQIASAAESPIKIVVLGDSISSGFGIAPSDAYPALLERQFVAQNRPVTVINAGVSGDTTSGGLRRVEWALSGGANLLVVALGGNDGLRGVPPDQTRKNLIEIIKKARALQPDILIVLAGMQLPDSMGPDYAKDFAAIYPEIAKETSATLMPFLLEGVATDPRLNLPDLIHPNEEGQKIIAAAFYKILSPLLDSPSPP